MQIYSTPLQRYQITNHFGALLVIQTVEDTQKVNDSLEPKGLKTFRLYATYTKQWGMGTVGNFWISRKLLTQFLKPIQLQKPKSIGIRGLQLKLFTEYLDDSRCVKIGNVFRSVLKSTLLGILLGSILDPTLFPTYINDLCNLQLDGIEVISYADETVLLFSANSDREVYAYAHRGFNVVNNWL